MEGPFQTNFFYKIKFLFQLNPCLELGSVAACTPGGHITIRIKDPIQLLLSPKGLLAMPITTKCKTRRCCQGAGDHLGPGGGGLRRHITTSLIDSPRRPGIVFLLLKTFNLFTTIQLQYYSAIIEDILEKQHHISSFLRSY